MVNTQQKIDLENLRYDSISQLYKDDLSAPPKRKTIPLLQFMLLPKEKKLAINELIKKEKRYHEFRDITAKHEEMINSLQLKKARYTIYFPSKKADKHAIAPDMASSVHEPIFHHDHTARYRWIRHPIKSWKKWVWRTFEKETILLINMELNNGKHISFLRPIDSEKFSILGGTYIVDIKLAYLSLSAGCYCLDYHQSLSIPVKRVWDVHGLKTAIESSGIIDCPAAANPSNITRFLNSNIIEQIFQGASLGKLLMIIIIIGIAGILTAVICTFILNGKIADLAKLAAPLVKK